MLTLIQPEGCTEYRVALFQRKNSVLETWFSGNLYVGCGIVSLLAQHAEKDRSYFATVASKTKKVSVTIKPKEGLVFEVQHFGFPRATYRCTGEDLVRYLIAIL